MMERDIDTIIDAIRHRFPNVEVHQLKVAHPADDDGIWYFYFPDRDTDDIQIESSNGTCPFLVESNKDAPKEGKTVAEVVALICSHLSTVEPNAG